MYRSYQIIQTIFVLLITLTGCEPKPVSSPKSNQSAEKGVKREDSDKKETITPRKITKELNFENLRIVSTAPSTTEFLFELGLGSKIVGVTKFCNYPQSVEKIPKVGGHTDPDLETILALKPTVVVGVDSSQREKTESILTKSKIRSVWVKVETVEDVLAVPDRLNKTFGIKSTESISAKMRSKLEPVAISDDKNRPKVLVIFGVSPMIVAGPNTYVAELVHRAGGKNIMESGPAYPQLDNEKLIALNPEIIIDVSYGEHAPLSDQLNAVKNKRVVRLENLDLMRPSPRIGEMFTFLKGAIGTTQK